MGWRDAQMEGRAQARAVLLMDGCRSADEPAASGHGRRATAGRGRTRERRRGWKLKTGAGAGEGRGGLRGPGKADGRTPSGEDRYLTRDRPPRSTENVPSNTDFAEKPTDTESRRPPPPAARPPARLTPTAAAPWPNRVRAEPAGGAPTELARTGTRNGGGPAAGCTLAVAAAERPWPRWHCARRTAPGCTADGGRWQARASRGKRGQQAPGAPTQRESPACRARGQVPGAGHRIGARGRGHGRPSGYGAWPGPGRGGTARPGQPFF